MIQNSGINPFVFGRVVTGEDFSPRREAESALRSHLASGRNTLIRTVAKRGGHAPQSRDFLEESGVRLPVSVKRAFQRLRTLEILYDDRGVYRFFDLFFRTWLQRS